MINYAYGDVTKPQAEHLGQGGTLIAHLCNDANGFYSGVAKSVADRWPGAKHAYHEAFHRHKKLQKLSEILQSTNPFIGTIVWFAPTDQADADLIIANMVGQHGFGKPDHDHVDYEALDKCLEKVYDAASHFGYNVIMPKIGSLRAGGNYPRIEQMIMAHAERCQVKTFIYVYDEGKA